MASGLASLAGYDSDSDDQDDSPNVATATVSQPTAATNTSSSSKLGSLLPPPKAGLASKLPPPSSPGARTGLSLPPTAPSSSSKRKVIKVDSLPSFGASGDGDDSDGATELRIDSKKPKLGASASNGTSSKHSLFGMLPAPKRKDDEVLAERSRQAEARKAAKAAEELETPASVAATLRFDEDVVRATSPEAEHEAAVDSNGKPKGKNNDAFRAMLGLKPSTKKPDSPAASSSSLTSSKLSSLPRASSPKFRATQIISDPAPVSSSKPQAAAPVDFFSLGTARPSNKSAASTSQTSSFSISAAPIIEDPEAQSASNAVDSTDDASEYSGWQLDPDGSWVPITPEAQAQFLAYQQSLAPPSTSTSTSKSASNLDGTRDLLAAGLTPEDIQAFDASTAARQAYLAAAGDEADSDKYAAAAEFAAGNREVQQRKPGMLKGLRKGQLSSLVSLASENRAQLEQRWQRGREAKARMSNQYGF